MKKTLTLTALSTKIFMLLCMSGMGLFGIIQEALASGPAPCHQEAAVDENDLAPCEMCKTALEAWEENAVTSSEDIFSQITNFEVSIEPTLQDLFILAKPSAGIYTTYYPPPQALLKAVTPNTKTTVILS